MTSFLSTRQDSSETVTRPNHLTSQAVVNGSSLASRSVYYSAMSEPVRVVSRGSSPYCVAFAANGDMLLTDDGSHCVYVCDANGRRKSTIGSQGEGEMEFRHPYGIAVRGEEVFVSDQCNHRVQKFTLAGNFMEAIGSEGSDSTQLSNPMGLCTGSDGKLYVADCGNDRVQVFHADGSFSHSISGGATFKTPFDVAFSSEGVHIAACKSNKVVVISPEGQFVRSYKVKSPVGVATDPAGFSFVTTHTSLGTLSIFDPHGHLVRTVNGLDNPFGVTVAPDGSVWVADYGSNRLLKY